MKTRNKAIPAAYIVLENADGAILFGKRKNTGYMDGWYQMPAGHVEEGELPSEAIIREAKEEVGIDIAPADLEFVHFSYRPKHDETGDRVDIFFRARKWKGTVTNVEPHKCEELVWISPHQLPKNTVPHVRDAIDCIYKTGKVFKELDLAFLKKAGVYRL